MDLIKPAELDSACQPHFYDSGVIKIRFARGSKKQMTQTETNREWVNILWLDDLHLRIVLSLRWRQQEGDSVFEHMVTEVSALGV